MQHPCVGGRDRRPVADLVAQPDQLRGDEVRIELQAGVLGEEIGVGANTVADHFGAAVLPDDRRPIRASG